MTEYSKEILQEGSVEYREQSNTPAVARPLLRSTRLHRVKLEVTVDILCCPSTYDVTCVADDSTSSLMCFDRRHDAKRVAAYILLLRRPTAASAPQRWKCLRSGLQVVKDEAGVVSTLARSTGGVSEERRVSTHQHTS